MKRPIQYTDAEAWISPNGNMFYGTHVDVAFRFYGHTDGPHRHMDEAGWWRICSRSRNAPEWVGLRPATRQQRQYIVRWVRERNRRNPWSWQAEQPLFCGILAEQERASRIMSR